MSSTISRREALAAFGGGAALAMTGAMMGVPGAKAADTALPLLHVGVIPIFSVAPHYAADKFGWFKAEGIDTTTKPVQGGAVGIPALASGSFDVLYANCISVLTALERGIDLRVIAEATTIGEQPPDADAIFIRATDKDKLKSGKDLEGKIIAVNAKFDLMWLVMQGYVQKTGGDANKVTYREVPVPSMLDALKSGQVDAALVLDPFMTIAMHDPNYALMGWPSSMVMPNMPSSLWVTSGQTADTKTDQVRAYVRGFMKGVAWYNSHLGTPEFFDLVASYSKTDVALLQKMYAAKQPTEISTPVMKQLVSVVKEYGLLKTDLDIESKIFKMPA
jgi:NitT/TauT family transport system substrate-binding protein